MHFYHVSVLSNNGMWIWEYSFGCEPRRSEFKVHLDNSVVYLARRHGEPHIDNSEIDWNPNMCDHAVDQGSVPAKFNAFT